MKYFQISEYYVIFINGMTNVLIFSNLNEEECHFPFEAGCHPPNIKGSGLHNLP